MKYLITFLGGGLLGVITGLFTAPRSGKKSRKKLVAEVTTRKENLEDAATRKLEEAKEILNKTVEKQAAKSKEFIDKTKESIILH